MERLNIVPGVVVLSGRQTMIVLWGEGSEVIACPLVFADEAQHRADHNLDWHELVEAGLTRLDVRCRAIPCQRQVLSLRAIGRVDEATVQRLRIRARKEWKHRFQENVPSSRTRAKSRYLGKTTAVWFDGCSMNSRREERLQMG
ncbi:hypothetical protein MKW11_06335 [Gluconobacter frateurii]|uniref:hypothetical protein n=1 Tax=Gluconobacter frateurii TaxID=38308 RepID=UPI001F06C1CA|nr:hypothetical protein [Gluconobacter frateurii]UMM09662.1 hypothetical protein MKW11_06335 [Gluconobacter frateurii]